MTTHEFAKLLLSVEDRPLVTREAYECQGEHSHGYSNVTGIDLDSTEEHAVISVDYLSAEVNDNFIKKGDIYVKLEGADGDFLFEREDAISLSLCKFPHYFNWDFQKVGFKCIDYKESFIGELDTLIDSKVKLAVSEGFHPQLKEMSVVEMMTWYEENLPELVAYTLEAF